MEKFTLPEITLTPLFYLELKQKNDVLMDATEDGEILLSPIVGGIFEGDDIKGTVLPIGTQYCIEKDNFRNYLDCTLILQTDDNEKILMHYRGTALFTKEQQRRMQNAEYVDPNEYYYRYTLKFKTGSKKYEWLNNKCCIAAIGVKDWETVCFEAYMVN